MGLAGWCGGRARGLPALPTKERAIRGDALGRLWVFRFWWILLLAAAAVQVVPAAAARPRGVTVRLISGGDEGDEEAAAGAAKLAAGEFWAAGQAYRQAFQLCTKQKRMGWLLAAARAFGSALFSEVNDKSASAAEPALPRRYRAALVSYRQYLALTPNHAAARDPRRELRALEQSWAAALVSLRQASNAQLVDAQRSSGAAGVWLKAAELALQASDPKGAVEAALQAAAPQAQPTAAEHAQALALAGQALAADDWDGDGCDDFGSDFSTPGCPAVPARARVALCCASVLDPALDPAASRWAAPLRRDVAAAMAKNLQARQDVRSKLIAGHPENYGILRAYAEALQAKGEDDGHWVAVRVLGHLVDAQPMAREAQEIERKRIASIDALARSDEAYARWLVADPKSAQITGSVDKGSFRLERQIAERKRYLAQFGKDSEWYGKWARDQGLANQVQATTRQIHLELTHLRHAAAQKLKVDRHFEDAWAMYAEAARGYEELLEAEPESKDAYRIAWTLAECWYWAGSQCSGPRDRDGELVVVDEAVAPTPAEKLNTVKSSCVTMVKSIAYYDRVRDWKGPRTRDDKGAPLDYTEPAAQAALEASERVLGAKAAYPKQDPEYLDSLSLPTIRPSSKQDDDDIKAAQGAKDVRRVVRKKLDPIAVERILAADRYVELSEKYPSAHDPGRPWRVALKAAELLYKNRHFDPWPEGATDRTPAEFWSARKRFRDCVARFPGTVAASVAVDRMRASFAIENDQISLEQFDQEIAPSDGPSREQLWKMKKMIKEVKEQRSRENPPAPPATDKQPSPTAP